MNQAKHPNIAAELQKRIVSGEYESKLPGISVLAEEYGVNSRTNALANPPNMPIFNGVFY